MIEVPLTKGQIALIDDEDAARVLQFKWEYMLNARSKRGYAKRKVKRNGKNHSVYLHRFLLNAPPGIQVDHINGNGLDNQKSNLRLATHGQNQFNSRKRVDSQNKYKGIYHDNQRGTYVARLKAKGYDISLGGFKTAIEAARAYDELARAYHGEFARLNFPNESEQAA